MKTNEPTAVTEADRKKYMRAALGRAKTAFKNGETPVGAVIVRDGKIIAGGRNKRENGKCALCHAELDAIRAASKKLGGWRLVGCELYVTLEPCPMCAGAIIASRIEKVYYGASDKKAGAFGGVFDLNAQPLNHHPAVEGGVCEYECSQILRDFFTQLRYSKKVQKLTARASDDTDTPDSRKA